MADYWKSQPRKFCEFCKCWIADNKSSRDFHERGKRHQENVKKKIDDLRKKGVKDAEKEAEMTDSLMAMEKAAMAALKKDLASNPDMAAQYGIKVKTEDTEKKESSEDTATEPVSTEPVSTEPSDPGPVDIDLEYWHEATNPEGYVYYWNSSTGESVWEKPKGYGGDAERAQQMAAAVAGSGTTSEKAESTAMSESWSRKRKSPGGPPGQPRGPRGLSYINDDKKRGSSLYTRKMSLVKKAIEFRNTTHKDVFIEMVTDNEHLVYGSPAMLQRYNSAVKLTRTVQQRLIKDNVPLPKEPLTDAKSKMMDSLPPVAGPPNKTSKQSGKSPAKSAKNKKAEPTPPITNAVATPGTAPDVPLENGDVPMETTPQKEVKEVKKAAKISAPKPCPRHKHGTRSKSRASMESGVVTESSSTDKDDIPMAENEINTLAKETEKEDITAPIEKNDTGKDPSSEPVAVEQSPCAAVKVEEVTEVKVEEVTEVKPVPCPSCGSSQSGVKHETDDKATQCMLIPVQPSYANKCRICNHRYFRKDKVSEWVGCAYIDNGQMCDYWVHVKCTGYNYKLGKTDMEIHYFCPQHIQ